jgi:ABC-type Zn2+ transport system substrate-binding protein/surface adhesin
LCDFRRVKVKIPFIEAADTKDHEEHKEHEHEHEHDHTVHQDIHIRYEWFCKGLVPPTIQIQVFERFSAFEKLNVQWVTNGQQGSVTLDKNMTTLEIKL